MTLTDTGSMEWQLRSLNRIGSKKKTQEDSHEIQQISKTPEVLRYITVNKRNLRWGIKREFIKDREIVADQLNGHGKNFQFCLYL